MTSAFTNPFLSSLERRRRSENIIAILNLFSIRETSRFNFWCEVFDIRDQGPWTGTTPRCLRLNESCWPKILYRKNYGDKKGSKSFQQQRKMFCRKFGWPSMKVLQIKVRRLKLFGCSLKLLANVQFTATRKRSVWLIPASYFTDLKKEHKCLKKSTVFILHFTPACVLLLVCSLQSAVCVLHWAVINIVIYHQVSVYHPCIHTFLAGQRHSLD